MWLRMADKTLVTKSPEMIRVLQIAKNLANTKSTVLIRGESGTGKELLARWLHHNSARADKPFVAVNCAALPEGLLESELFGHEKGAFTSAHSTQVGRFELAHKGTFLLDEISELPLPLQGKLLRTLQEGEIDRLGSGKSIKVDVRLLATTNRDLKVMVKEGAFRADLFYRLNVLPIHTLPLRERPEDVEVLGQFFLDQACSENQLKKMVLSKCAKERLLSHSWPGNIRELENVIKRSALLCDSDQFEARHVQFDEDVESCGPVFRVGMSLKDMEKILIHKTLELTDNNKSQAAHILGITVRTLRNKLTDYRMEESP